MKKRTTSKSVRSEPVPGGAATDSPPLWPYLLLTILAFGIYGNALGNGFVSDDNSQLLNNRLVTDWRQIPEIFRHNAWAFAGQQTSNYYRPIQTLSYMALYYGFGFNALVFHSVMILIHVLNTLLVYKLGGRLLASRSAALAAGIIFAVHPIHNEPVVWVAAMPDILVTLEVLAGVTLFGRWNAAPRSGQIGWLALLFFLALLTKEPGAMLIPLLAGYEFLYLGRSLWLPAKSEPIASAHSPRTLVDNWPLYASLTAVFGAYAVVRIRALGGMAPSQGGYRALGGKVLLFSVVRTLGQYLAASVAPIHLSYFHVFEPAMSMTPLVAIWLALELSILSAIFLLRARAISSESLDARNKKNERFGWNAPAVSYGLFFFLTTLAPALNINGIGENVFAERYLYLPSVGFVLVAAVAWQWLAGESIGEPRRKANARRRVTAWAVVAAIVVASTWALWPRNLDWHDDLTLLRVSVEASPQSGTLLGSLGGAYAERGEYDSAIEKYLMALRVTNLQPELALFHNGLGSAYVHKERYQDAVAEFQKAIQLKSDLAPAHMNLGLALEALGDTPGATAEQVIALKLQPQYGEASNALALLRMKAKDYPEAIELLQHAIAVNPRHTEAYINLGVACNGSHRYAEAVAALRKAIEVGADHPMLYVAHYDLGVSYSHLNSWDAAALEFSRSLQLKPDYAAAREALVQAQNVLKEPSRKPY